MLALTCFLQQQQLRMSSSHKFGSHSKSTRKRKQAELAQTAKKQRRDEPATAEADADMEVEKETKVDVQAKAKQKTEEKKREAKTDIPEELQKKTEEAVLQDLAKLRDEMLADFQVTVPDIAEYIEARKKSVKLHNPLCSKHMCYSFDECRRVRQEREASVESERELLRKILRDDISTPYTIGMKQELAQHLPRFSSDLLKLVYDLVVPVSFAKHPLFYEPGLFRVLNHSYRDDDRTRDPYSHPASDREKQHFEKPAVLDPKLFKFITSDKPAQDVTLRWNPDSVLHWAMRVTSQFKPSPLCAGKVMERCLHDLKAHWGMSCYKKTLAALLFCQETLGIVGSETWIVFPLQRAYGLSVDFDVDTPAIELNMMKLMNCV